MARADRVRKRRATMPRPTACRGFRNPGSDLFAESRAANSEAADDESGIDERGGLPGAPGADDDAAQAEGGEGEPEEPEVEEEGDLFDLGAHREMLQKDTTCMEAFRQAIFETCKGKVVLEIGCSTGLLSVFAAQAGAKRVVSVEANPDAARLAMEVVHANGFSDVVSVVEGYIADAMEDVDELLEAEGGSVDVIISDWMGDMLVGKDLFRSFAFARDRWLVLGGVSLPSRCDLWLAPFDNEALLERQTGYWFSRPYGVDLSVLAGPAVEDHLSRPVIDVVQASGILASPQCIFRLDCSSARDDALMRHRAEYRFALEKEGTFHGLAVWFTCELLPGISFSTGPKAPPTTWRQTLLFAGPESLAYGVRLVAGDSVRGQIKWLVAGMDMGVVVAGLVRRTAAPKSPLPFGRRLVLNL